MADEYDKRAKETPSRPIEKDNPFVIKKKQRVPFATEKFKPKIRISSIYQAVVVAVIYGTDEWCVTTTPACYYRRH